MPAGMRILAGIFCAGVILVAVAAGAVETGLTVKGVRFFSYPGFTRIVFEAERAAPYVMTRSGDGRSLYFSSYGEPFALTAPRLPVINDGVVKGLEHRREGDQQAVIIHLAPAAGDAKDFVLRGPDRIVLDVYRGVLPAAPTGAGGKTVVLIDPGHGGLQDSGIATPRGPEKEITLGLANALRRALRKSAVPMTVHLTRDADVRLSADERASAANTGDADVFVSIHLAPGAESRVFLLDPDEGRTVAAGSVPGDFLGFDAVSDQQERQWGTQQAEYAQESGRLGRIIVRALTGADKGEPDQAPILALKAVAAPAVLVEIGTEQDRQRAMEAVAKGIEQYVRAKR